MKEKTMKTVKILTITLLVILISMINFVGIYQKNKNRMENKVKDYSYSMSLNGARTIKLKVNTESTDDVPNNSEEVLTAENYKKSKEVIEKRLNKMNVEEYTTSVNEATGEITIQIPEQNSQTDTIIGNLNTVGKFEILGISKVKQKNDDLDTTVKKATKLASTDYQQKVDELNSALKKLEVEKSNYEDLANVSTESEIQAANKTYNTIDFLFVRIENHAKSEGVTIEMKVTRSASGESDTYDLNFSATGTYTGIEEFITDLEDDSKLGFKIEDFSMTATSGSNGEQVEATFVCKNIIIKGIENTSASSGSMSGTTKIDSSTDNTNSTNTTDNTTTDNTVSGNTTNSVNKAQ